MLNLKKKEKKVFSGASRRFHSELLIGRTLETLVSTDVLTAFSLTRVKYGASGLAD